VSPLRSQRLIDQMELQLEVLVASSGEDETKTEAPRVPVQDFMRRQATRRNSGLESSSTSP
jgi:hypothetical protein